MAFFPLFVELKGKKCVVVGGGEIALRKIELLLQFEASPVIIAPEINSFIEELERQGKISIIKMEYCRQVMEGAFLVIAATSVREVNENVFRDATDSNIPVNVVDDPEKCTFIFPSVVKRGDLVIGISTSGKYPALTKKIRKTMESQYTDEYSDILNQLAHFRIRVRNSIANQQQKERILKNVIDQLFCGAAVTCEALSSIIEKYDAELV